MASDLLVETFLSFGVFEPPAPEPRAASDDFGAIVNQKIRTGEQIYPNLDAAPNKQIMNVTLFMS